MRDILCRWILLERTILRCFWEYVAVNMSSSILEKKAALLVITIHLPILLLCIFHSLREKDKFYSSNRIYNQSSNYKGQGSGKFGRNRQNFHSNRYKKFYWKKRTLWTFKVEFLDVVFVDLTFILKKTSQML